LNQGGINDAKNVQPLCVPCHEKKDGYKRKPGWWWKRLIRKIKTFYRRIKAFRLLS
jgi:hypothetical protein